MVWLWPMTRDLRTLERSTVRFGDRNWSFDASIATRSPVYPLAEAFRRMAARIDGLIGSHKDMSNALSHEIKTPLARMRFEIELARVAADREALLRHLDHLNTDVTELNAFVTATLEYAVLERAEVALNVATHDFTAIVPVLTESVKRDARSGPRRSSAKWTATRRRSCATCTSWRRCCATFSTTRFVTRRARFA